MHKKIITMTVSAFAVVPAFAQSSVTLYGTADAGVGKTLVGGSGKTEMISGSLMNNSTSYIEFTGREDLGGGLNSGFDFGSNLNLKDGSNLTTGPGAGYWGRTSKIWLGGPWGTLQLGRTYNPAFLAMISWQLTMAANYSVVGNTYNWGGNGVRQNGLIDYRTPNFNGFSGDVSYIMKDNNIINGTGYARWDGAIRYSAGPVVAALSADKTDGSKTSYTLGGKYKFGQFSFASSYNQSARNDALRRGFSLGGQGAFGAMTLTLDVTRDIKNDWNMRKYTNELVEARYALSKRTFVYAAYLHLDGSGNYGVGLRHNF
ncbi:MAG: porin [Burkholderiaceae bacterium]|nr:MAG: porin [Burkholderiaceae bacterium]